MISCTYAMIERNGIDNHKIGQVVLVRSVIAVPGNNIEGAVTLFGFEQVAGVFVYYFEGGLYVFVVSSRSFKVPRVGQPVRT